MTETSGVSHCLSTDGLFAARMRQLQSQLLAKGRRTTRRCSRHQSTRPTSCRASSDATRTCPSAQAVRRHHPPSHRAPACPRASERHRERRERKSHEREVSSNTGRPAAETSAAAADPGQFRGARYDARKPDSWWPWQTCVWAAFGRCIENVMAIRGRRWGRRCSKHRSTHPTASHTSLDAARTRPSTDPVGRSRPVPWRASPLPPSRPPPSPHIERKRPVAGL